MNRIRPVRTDGIPLHVKFAIGFGIAACIGMFWLSRYEIREYLVANQNSHWKTAYQQLFITDTKQLIGLAQSKDAMQFDWLTNKGEKPVRIPAGTKLWGISPLGGAIAWVEGRVIKTSAGKEIVLAGAAPAAMALPADNRAALAYASGKVELVSLETGQAVKSLVTRIEDIDIAIANGDYLAVGSSAHTGFELYRVSDQGLSLTEQGKCPRPPYQITLPAPGLVGFITGGAYRLQGKPISVPGAIKTAVIAENRLIATGDFDDIQVIWQEGDPDRPLPPVALERAAAALFKILGGVNRARRIRSDGILKGALGAEGGEEAQPRAPARSPPPPAEDSTDLNQFYTLTEASPAAVIATGHKLFAWSGKDGTHLADLEFKSALTPRGNKFLWLVLGIMAVAAFCGMFGLFLDALTKLFETHKKRRLSVGRKFNNVPPELARACGYSRCVLFAGSGLSASAGLPAWRGFVGSALVAARAEGWLPHQKLQGLNGKFLKHDILAAMQGLLEQHRSHIFSMVKQTYGGSRPGSRVHTLLSRLRFPCAITTNFDTMLDSMSAFNMARRLAATREGDREAAKSQSAFVLHLLGTIEEMETIRFSCGELRQEVRAELGETLGAILSKRTTMFLGCSPAGLLADFAALGVPPASSRTHFLLTGVSEPVWRNQAKELKNKYGIETLAVDEDNVGPALTEFLERLTNAAAAEKAAAAAFDSTGLRRLSEVTEDAKPVTAAEKAPVAAGQDRVAPVAP